MEKPTVFDETYNKYLLNIRNIDLLSYADRLGAEPEKDGLVISFYKKPFQITKDGVFDETGKQANFAVSVVLFQHIFHCPVELPVTGDWVAFRNFRDASPLSAYFTANNSQIIETTFEGNVEALQSVSERLGGSFDHDPAWDLSVTFHMLPRIPVRLRFNDKDEEFPAQSSILFRQSAESYIDMESLAIGVTYLTNMLSNR